MSDPKTSLEIIAPSVDEAITRGSIELGLPAEALDVEIVDEGSRGFLGLGSRQVRVRLSIREGYDAPKDLPVLEPTAEEVIKPPVKHIPVEGGVVDISGEEAELQLMKDNAYQYLKELTGKLNLMGVSVSCEVMISQDGESTADTIIRAEKELNGDLVAMSLPGKHGLRHWTTHHTAEKVLDHGSVPVIMVTTND